MCEIAFKENQTTKQIKIWISYFFHLPKSCEIEIFEKKLDIELKNAKQTTFHINYRKQKKNYFTIHKSLNATPKEDILNLCKNIKAPFFRRFPLIGQVVNSLLGDKLGQRVFGTIGMTFSTIFNILFGLSYAFPLMLAFWIANGFVQSTGAPLRIKNLENWFLPTERGSMMGFLGTDYLAGNVLSWLLSGFLISKFGWRLVFFVPGIIAPFFITSVSEINQKMLIYPHWKNMQN